MQKLRRQYLTTLHLSAIAIAWLLAIPCGCAKPEPSLSRGIHVFSPEESEISGNSGREGVGANNLTSSGSSSGPSGRELRNVTQDNPSPANVGYGGTPSAPPLASAPGVNPSVVQGPRGSRPGLTAPAQQGPVSTTKRTNEQALLLRSARTAITLKQIDEASDLFESYLIQVPNDHEIRTEYAGVLVQKGLLNKARDLYLNTLQVLPRSTDIRHKLVDVLIMSGEYSAATIQLENIIELDPDDLAAAAMLCRSYSWVKDLERAKMVFDRYLRKLDPTKQYDQTLLAPALLDMQKPREALPYLLKLHTKSPNELEWATSLVYCYELLGDEEKATRAVIAMATLEPTVTDSRIHLVDQLLALNNYQLALQVNQQILQADPQHVMARLMSARILLESYDIRRAKEALRALDAELGGMRRYSLAMAQLYHQVGQWVASQSIYEAMLMDRPNDDEVRIRLALLLREKGDLHRALAELNKIAVDSPYGSLAQLEQGSTLILQGRPEKAAGLCSQIADMRPHDVAPVIGLVRAHIAMDHLEEARALCQHFIDKHPSDKMAIAQIRVVLGKTQLLAGDSVQAARTYQLAMREPSMHEPEAFYGLAKGRARGDFAVGSEIARLSSNIATSGEGIRMRIELGKLALGEQDYKRATYYLTKALRWQPNNIAAQVLLGEALNLALKAGNKTDPVKVFSAVLENDPGNTRALLGLARSHAIKRDFEMSLKAYDQVLEQDSGYDYAAREHARTLFWDQQYDESISRYERLIARLPSDDMAVDFFDDPVDNVALQALSDFESNTDFATAVRLELIAKQNMSWRPPIAQQALEELIIREPANQEALFDLAQLEHRRGLTDDAIDHYKDLIKVAGGHQEAAKALAGAKRELVPSFNLRFDNEERNGRDGLSFMDESSAIADTRFALGNKNDTFGFGLGRRTYNPGPVLNDPNYEPLNANVVRFFGSKALGENTVVDGLGEFHTYDADDKLSERLYYDAGVTYISDEQTTVKLRFFSEPVAQNYVTLAQDLYRQGGRVGLESALTRRLDWGVSGLIADYSDDNTRVEGNVFASYEFTAAPTELRVLIKADFIDSSNEMGVVDQTTQLAQLDTPYFSPKGYSVFSLQTNWQHQLGKEWFTGADDMFYKVMLGVAVDSNNVAYTEFGMGGGYDLTEWLRLEVGVRMVRSSAIDITSGFGMITVRWP